MIRFISELIGYLFMVSLAIITQEHGARTDGPLAKEAAKPTETTQDTLCHGFVEETASCNDDGSIETVAQRSSPNLSSLHEKCAKSISPVVESTEVENKVGLDIEALLWGTALLITSGNALGRLDESLSSRQVTEFLSANWALSLGWFGFISAIHLGYVPLVMVGVVSFPFTKTLSDKQLLVFTQLTLIVIIVFFIIQVLVVGTYLFQSHQEPYLLPIVLALFIGFKSAFEKDLSLRSFLIVSAFLFVYFPVLLVQNTLLISTLVLAALEAFLYVIIVCSSRASNAERRLSCSTPSQYLSKCFEDVTKRIVTPYRVKMFIVLLISIFTICVFSSSLANDVKPEQFVCKTELPSSISRFYSNLWLKDPAVNGALICTKWP